MSAIVVEGFHRTDDAGTSVTFAGSIRDPEALTKYLREEGVYGASDAEPVIVLVGQEEQLAGNCVGSVGVAVDNEQRLLTIERAILALESVRDGLRETGHHDHG